MYKYILIGLNKNKDELSYHLETLLPESLSAQSINLIVDKAQNTRLIENRLQDPNRTYDILLLDMYLPSESDQVSYAEDRMGLQLIKRLREYGIMVPSILIAQAIDPESNFDIARQQDCIGLAMGENFDEQVVQCCTNLLKEPGLPNQATMGDKAKIGRVELIFNMDKNQWEFIIKGWGQDLNYSASGALDINPSTIKDLIRRSRYLQDIKEWEEELKCIGRDLFREIFKNNYKFTKHFHFLENKVGDNKRINFSFKVAKNIHPILLEAICEDEEQLDEDIYFMLKSPIYRRPDVSGDYNPLHLGRSGHREAINCLIIVSDVKGPVPEIEQTLVRLSNIAPEAEMLCGLFNEYRQQLNLQPARVISRASEGKTFSETVREALKSNTWHMVHYAGHSYYSSKDHEGYVIFPGKKKPEIINIKAFGERLRTGKTQLVYLSSCHSSEENFVFELAKQGIPAIIGFRWDLEDKLAQKYTACFYRQLFQHRLKLEQAFLETRKEMHYQHIDNRIWASPMLIMQVND